MKATGITLPKIVILTLLVIYGNFLSAQSIGTSPESRKAVPKTSGIIFLERSWSEVLEIAAKDNKLIFLDAYATWCGPCKLLKSTTFKDKDVADFFNRNFINVSMDMEKGEGIELSDKWEIQSYPTLIVLDARGKTVLETVGFLKPKNLIKFGKQALTGRK